MLIYILTGFIITDLCWPYRDMPTRVMVDDCFTDWYMGVTVAAFFFDISLTIILVDVCERTARFYLGPSLSPFDIFRNVRGILRDAARCREIQEKLRKAELCCHFMNTLIQARTGQQAVPPDRTVKGIIFKPYDGNTPLIHLDNQNDFLYVQGFELEKSDNSRHRVITLANNWTFIGNPRHLPSIGVSLHDEIHI